MTFSDVLQIVKQRGQLPAEIAVPEPRIELGRINGQSSASLRLETGGSSSELSSQQLQDLAQP